MAGQLYKTGRSADPYLSPNQQDLLLAALNSQAGAKTTASSQVVRPTIKDSKPHHSHSADDSPAMSASNAGSLLMSPLDADLDTHGIDMTPDLDYLDSDNFDFENADLGGDMIGALPGTGADAKTSGEGHEKRKSPDENDGSEEGDAKRQETQEGEKQAKKPGRKPLTSEPTTKRKAQNRAAQRAFRERKEKHLKDLESKVSELTKAREADKHENGLLKAQVERLRIELREERKRLSLNSSSVSRSPTLSGAHGQQRSNSNPSYGNAFQFDFPKFGGLPGSQIFGNTIQNNGIVKRDSATPPTYSPRNGTSVQANFVQGVQSQNSRQNSMGQSMSPQSNEGSVSNTGSPSQFANLNPSFSAFSTNDNMHGFASMLPQMNSTASSDPFGDLFSPSILKSTSPSTSYFGNSQDGNTINGLSNFQTPDGGNDSTSGLNRVFQFNGGSNTSDSTSPSASSTSQWNTNGTGNSSCETSPEPSHDSPVNKDSDKAPSQKQFGNNSNSNNGQTGLDTTFGLANADFSMPSLSGFDPVLFGDYRDNNDVFLDGSGNLNSGFFDDALNQPFDMGSPSNLFGILQSPQQTHTNLSAPSAPPAPCKVTTPSKSLMAEIEKARDGGDDDYGLPRKTESTTKLISCNNIWSQLQSNPDFQEGKFDLDNLCAELRSKARCSESGVMVDQSHVDQALRKLGKKDQSGKTQDVPPLMFEQESWDNVLKKLQSGNH